MPKKKIDAKVAKRFEDALRRALGTKPEHPRKKTRQKRRTR
jgi:hypothetical protein